MRVSPNLGRPRPVGSLPDMSAFDSSSLESTSFSVCVYRTVEGGIFFRDSGPKVSK